MEIYKDIEGYENLYQISNLGNVKSLGNDKKRKEKVLKPFNTTKGYLQVELFKNGNGKKYFIHRLVAEAFIPNPNNYPIINHKDENPLNNNISNLEWCTSEYNNNYGTHNKKIVESRSKQVMCLETGKIYQSGKQVERQLGFAQGNISLACNGKLKQAYGYTWKFV